MTQSRLVRKFLVPILVVCGTAGAGFAIAGADSKSQVQLAEQPLVMANAAALPALGGSEGRSVVASARHVGSIAAISTRMNTAVDDARRVTHALAVATAIGSEAASQDALLEADLVNVPEALREPSAAALLAAGFVSMLVIVRQRLKR